MGASSELKSKFLPIPFLHTGPRVFFFYLMEILLDGPAPSLDCG